MRIAGALYLVYVGVRTILAAHQAVPTAISTLPAVTPWTAWRAGFLTDISNPKAAAFFGSLFAALLPVHAPVLVVVTAVLLVVVIEFVWYCSMAYLFSLQPVAQTYRRAKRWIDYVTGGVYILLGGRLAVSR